MAVIGVLRTCTVVVPDSDRYLIVQRPTGQCGILCVQCGRTSWHPCDVMHRYCHACHTFFEERHA